MIKIRKPGKIKFEGVSDINECLQPHFITLLIGKPSSGKSHIIREFITNPQLYYKKFNAIYFISASRIDGLEMDEDNWIPYLDIDWMFDKIGQEEREHCSRNILFVLDDVIGEIKQKQHDARMMKLIFNRRHLINGCIVSYLITTQKYIVCPPRLRSCLTAIISFKVMRNDFKKIVEECIYDDIDKHKLFIIKSHLMQPYNFIYIRLDNGDLYLNFNKFEY